MRHSLQRTAIRKRPMKLGTTVILMVSAVLFSVLLVVHLIYFSQISNMTRDALAGKALAVARTLADSPEIRQGLMKKPEESGIQAIAQAVNKSNDFLFIVVTNMQSIRYSHPEAKRIGQPFKGDDILLALEGKENVAINRGFLAKALRVFTPIYDEHHRQIGVVAIGLELSRVTEQINDSRGSIIWSVLFGVLVGLLGTWVFVKVLKRILFGLEPYEISNLFEQRQAMLHSIKEGVIAVDECGEVTLINQAAQELLDYHKLQDDAQLSTLSHAWSQVVDLSDVLRDGTPRRDEEITVKDRLLLINTVPVLSNGKIIGAISTFRDKTEVRKLMQRLDGMVNYADALRERSHEFMNKLHVILGLLHLKSYKQLENYIIKTANNYQEEIGSLLGKIKSPVIAGFLLSKINRTSDLGHTLIISNESQLPENSNEDQVTVLITVLGNLIENALEALGQEPGGEISVSLHYRHGWLHCEVNDDGPGIAPEHIDRIFEKGVSSKGTERGVGLALVKQQVENVGGNISVESEPGIFTQFFVQLPWNGERASR
ncbi:sensor histidine kinase [Citrobacter sp. Marseille-Q6884]|uniref:sensor histidine kinase n=1 Tax=Citrobacter sp. Marseille-Q6884 TaxID=2956786 RepID=UPI0021B36E10|nr:sensor histidine kinase [Citrobacter sp. Marseille-Q6884]EMF0720738.1 two-component system sensor histidine kinase DcuS [Citrobacter freundii]